MSAHSVAAVLTGFGGPGKLQLREQPLPVPRPGEIIVQVEAASINPIDVRRAGGYGRRMLSLMGAGRPPIVLGNDFAGRVFAVGRGVTAFREGDSVFGAKPPSSAGSHASHVAVKAEHAVLRPPGIGAIALATLPYNYLTVRRAMADAGLTADSMRGRPVLVHGASGGLGLLAIALLNAGGARVTAVAGRAAVLCSAAGADEVVDRHRRPLRDLSPHFAATLNFANWDDDAQLLALLAPDALGHATTVHPLLAHFDQHGLLKGAMANMRAKRQARRLVPDGARYGWTFFRPVPAALADLGAFAVHAAGTPNIKTFGLDQVASAHRHVEHRRLHRAVLLPQQF